LQIKRAQNDKKKKDRKKANKESNEAFLCGIKWMDRRRHPSPINCLCRANRLCKAHIDDTVPTDFGTLLVAGQREHGAACAFSAILNDRKPICVCRDMRFPTGWGVCQGSAMLTETQQRLERQKRARMCCAHLTSATCSDLVTPSSPTCVPLINRSGWPMTNGLSLVRGTNVVIVKKGYL
jgi:hypothetical protein